MIVPMNFCNKETRKEKENATAQNKSEVAIPCNRYIFRAIYTKTIITIENKFTSKKISILMLLIVVLIGKVFSAPPVNYCEINGIVKDSITGEGLPFASVLILSQNDSNIVKGVITDVAGNYAIKNIVPGKYRLIASYMGYNENEIITDIQAKKEKHMPLI